jgi:hypothetical protein
MRTPEVLTPRHGRGVASTEAFDARKHDVVTRRTAKGGQTQKVTRRGTPYVIGSWSHDVEGAAGWSGALAVAIEQHAGRYGARAAEILAVTDALFGDDIPPLLGSDTLSFEEIVRPIYETVELEGVMLNGEPITTTIGPDLGECRVAVSHAGLTGSDRVADVDSLAAHSAVYRAHTANLERWPTRYRLRTPKLRKAEREATAPTTAPRRTTIGYRTDDTARTIIHRVHYTAPRWETSDTATTVRPATVTELPAATDDKSTLFVGHRKMTRPPTTREQNSGKREARTIEETDTVPATAEAVEALVARLAPGDAIKMGPAVRVSRGKAGKYSVTDQRPGARKPKRSGLRTTLAVARGLVT